MKNIFAILLFLNLAVGFGQTTKDEKKDNTIKSENNSSESVNGSINKHAEPVGGLRKFYKDLSSKMIVPEVDIAGTYKTKVKFIVNQNGSLSDFEVKEETPYNIGLGKNVIKYLQTIANWIPAEQDGRKVRTNFLLPVSVVLTPETDIELKKKD